MTPAARRNRERRKQEGRALIRQAKGDRCVRCRTPQPPERLHLHHRDPTAKTFTVSTWTRRPTRTIGSLIREIAKCDPLCRECHDDEHRDENRQRALTARRDPTGQFLPRHTEPVRRAVEVHG